VSEGASEAGAISRWKSAILAAVRRAIGNQTLIRAERLADVSRLSISAKQVHETQLKHG
jgi:hypothetical protein